MRRTAHILLAVGSLAIAVNSYAQQPAPAGRGAAPPTAPAAAGRGAAPAPAVKPPALFFRETFYKDTAGAIPARPLATTDVVSPNVELKMYGPGAPAKPDHESGVQLNVGTDALTGSIVSWVWTGMAEDSWAVTLRDKVNYVDLNGMAKIRWRVRQRGLQELRPIVKLADGTMLVGDYGEPESTYWRENEFYLVDVQRWRVLDEKQVIGSTDAAWRIKPDLSKVDEVGFTDLMRGAGHGQGGNSGVDWIEVYGNPVKR